MNYYKKYLKYKQKYLELKQKGGSKENITLPITFNKCILLNNETINPKEYNIYLGNKSDIKKGIFLSEEINNKKFNEIKNKYRIYDCTNEDTKKKAEEERKRLDELIKENPILNISGIISYYFFKIKSNNGEYKNILIFGEEHSIYKKQPEHLDLIKFYKLCIILSYISEQCLDLFAETPYNNNENRVITQYGGNCTSSRDTCVNEEMLIRTRELFNNGKTDMLEKVNDTEEGLQYYSSGSLEQRNLKRYSGDYDQVIKEYRKDTAHKEIKFDYTRFQDLEISQMFNKDHFVYLFSFPKMIPLKKAFNYDNENFFSILKKYISFVKSTPTPIVIPLDSFDSLTNDQKNDIIKYTLKSLYYFFIGIPNDEFSQGEKIFIDIYRYIYYDHNYKLWFSEQVLESWEFGSRAEHKKIAMKVKKQLDNIDENYFTTNQLIDHFITRIDNYVEGNDYWSDQIDGDFNMSFLFTISKLRLFFTDIYAIARMFRKFTKVNRHKCDEDGSLSKIIYLAGNGHSRNFKYFLEKQFGVKALYKQSAKNVDRYDRYIKLNTNVLKEFGFEDIINWNDSKYKTITPNENKLE